MKVCQVGALLEMQVLFEGGPYMRKYGNLLSKEVLTKGEELFIHRTKCPPVPRFGWFCSTPAVLINHKIGPIYMHYWPDTYVVRYL